MKISLSGCAGTGRTAVVHRLADKTNTPIITGVARQILEKEGYEYGSDVTVEKFLATPDRQRKIFDYKKKLETEAEKFITDRSWVDQAAYAILELNNQPGFDLTTYVDDCREESQRLDMIVYVPWNCRPLEPNNLRTLNPWYQLTVDSVIFNLLHRWNVEYITLPNGLTPDKSVKWIIDSLRSLHVLNKGK